MIKSMTGYGRAVLSAHGRTITVEIKSVNHRYFDCTVKLPRVYGFLEDPLKKLLQSGVSRGKLECGVLINEDEGADIRVQFNEAVFNAYYEAMRAMCEKYNLRDDLSVTSLSRFPEVFTVERRDVDEDELTADVLAAAQNALADFTAMREREGEKLHDDLKFRAGEISAMVDKIAERAPQISKAYLEKLTARIREILEGADPDEGRLLTEAAIFADRAAIDEEIVRLYSHISQLLQMISSDAAVGRKLDFLIQEFNREANTIGSKANDLDLSRIVVDLKAEIEKVREQVQNIE